MPLGPFFAPMLQPNRTRPKTHWHEFWVLGSGMGPSVAKNSTASRSAQKLARTGPRDPFFAPVLRPNRNNSKTHWHEFGVQRSGLGPSVVKNPIACRSAQKWARIGPQDRLSRRCSDRTGIARTPTDMSLGSNGVDWVRPSRKIQL